MTLNKLIIVGLGSFLLTAVSSALPGGSGGPKKPKKSRPLFEEVDADKDGKISEAEFLAIAKDQEKGKKIFAKKDKDGDGFLSKEEFAKKKKKGPKKPKKEDA